MVDRHAPPLGVHARTQHIGRAEQYADASGVHLFDHLLAFALAAGCLLYETNLGSRNAVVFDQLAPNLGVHVPLVSRLPCPQIGEDELRALVLIVLAVILRDLRGTVARLIVHMIAVQLRVDHTHIERHFTGVVRSDQHFGFLLAFREGCPAQHGGIACLGEMHQLVDKRLLVGRGRDVVQYLVLARAVDTDVLGRAEIRNFRIKSRQLRNLDEIAEAFFLHDLVGDRELVIDALFGEYGGPCVEGADVLPVERLRTQVFEQQIQLREGVGNGRPRQKCRPQIAPRALLYGSEGKEHVECPLAPVGVAEARHAVVPRIEHQIFEFVRFVHAEVVDTHTAEVHRIVPAMVEGVLRLLQFGLQIVLALEAAGQHTFRHALALRFEQHKVLFYAVEFRPQDLLLDFGRLRDHAELLVREDHRIPVVVLDLPEYLLALLRREILAARIEHAGHRIGRTEGFGDLMDIGFQSRNYRFVHQSDAFFLVGSAAHDKRLAAADLMVHDTAAQQNIHPDSVLLARIEVFDA